MQRLGLFKLKKKTKEKKEKEKEKHFGILVKYIIFLREDLQALIS